MEKKLLLGNYHRRVQNEVQNCGLFTTMNKETLVHYRPDREIRKTVVKPGDYTMVAYEDSRCKIRIWHVKSENQAGPCEIEPECRIFNSPFDGNVIIGDMDSYIDKDVELILQQMCLGEICDARLIYKNVFGDLMMEISCRIELLDLTEEQLISDWSWARLFESAVHHKERGVQLVKDKRIVDGFRRFSKALKMLVAIEPVDRVTADAERTKELLNMRIKLYNNMAHCQLQFDEFGATLDLCSRTLKLDHNNIKALYRQSIAYTGLAMYEEAWGDIQRALEIDPTDKASIAKAKELRPHIEKINKDYSTVIKKMFG
ncbi:uncharacterized protein LOC112050551 [Bicyclus anynana]|uniref:Uncharacterized protein LOC112050551 n=1 Tax=Bicyclus anynana TaxID=110368 RepID=A0A6J1NCG9_BICAN|nr:uncharacterized protein LOC112050551 [Bicyclus anynana]